MTTTTTTASDVLKSILPDQAQFGKLFDMMEVAEDEIDKAMRRHPDRAGHIFNAFKLFGNEAAHFYDFDLRLWRAHVVEILERVAKPKTTKLERELGTNAQACLVFYHCSMKTPLTSDATYAYYQVGTGIMGQYFGKCFDSIPDLDRVHESYPGAVQELIDEARLKTSVARHFPTDEEVAKRPVPDFRLPGKKQPAQPRVKPGKLVQASFL